MYDDPLFFLMFILEEQIFLHTQQFTGTTIDTTDTKCRAALPPIRVLEHYRYRYCYRGHCRWYVVYRRTTRRRRNKGNNERIIKITTIRRRTTTIITTEKKEKSESSPCRYRCRRYSTYTGRNRRRRRITTNTRKKKKKRRHRPPLPPDTYTGRMKVPMSIMLSMNNIN